MEFIYEYEGLLSPEFCSHVIEKFEKSDHKTEGKAGGGVNTIIKKSLDLPTYKNPYWKEELSHFEEMIKIGMDKYNTFIQGMQVDNEIKKTISDYLKESFIYPPQIQKTLPGGYFHWHHDECSPPNPRRFTYIIYLNDVEEDSGGTTEFACGKTIQPKAGKIIFFPSTWTYFHRGKTLEKGVKYIATASLDRVPPHVSTSSNSGEMISQPIPLDGINISELMSSIMKEMNNSR